MSLDATRLGIAMTAAVAGAIPGTDPTVLAAMCNAIASTVIAEFTANASVVPTLLIAPSGGGPVTGTGKVA